MTNLSFDLENKRRIFVISHFRVSFQIFQKLFRIFTSIHRLSCTTNLRWRYKVKTRKIWVFTWVWSGDSNEIDPCKLLVLLVSFETENKSVFDLLLLRTGLILLQFLLFSSLRDRAGICHPWWWIRTELRSKLFDDDDLVEDYWEQCWILRNCDESWLNLNSGIF